MNRILLWCAFTAVLVTSLGCGGGSDSVTGTSPNVNGTWDAVMTTTGGTQAAVGVQFTVTLVLVQTGTDVVGTFSTEGGTTGILTGTISGSAVTLTATQAPPCDGTYTAVGTLDASSTTMTGTFDGSDCNGTLQATFTATKQ